MPHKVMIIDDSTLVLTIVRHQLEQAGFDVVTRESALGTAAAVLREQPDIILMDVMMPALGGETLVPLLRKQPTGHELRILFFSDRPPESLQAMARAAGADGFVTKGTPPEMLVAQLHATMRSRPVAAPMSAAPSSPTAGIEPFVLFVDSDPGLRALCRTMVPLGASGFIHSGHEALRIIQGGQPPMCVFAGAHLSDMRGEDLWDAAVAIDDYWRDKVVLMSDTEAAPAAPHPEQASGPRRVPRPAGMNGVETVRAAMRRP